MRDSPWYHQKRSESAPPANKVREPPTITAKEQNDITARLSRPTESALYRQSLFWKLDGFMDKGFHSWSKMDLFDDSKRCMWNKDGAIKRSCKIRPLIKGRPLPPLMNSSRDIVKSCNGLRSPVRSECSTGRDCKLNASQSWRSGPNALSRSNSQMECGAGRSRTSLSREGIHLKSGSRNAQLGPRNYGFLRVQSGYKTGSVEAPNMAVPTMSQSRPVAAIGVRS